jgi:pimeloyl-[acyl-carrier protein] methyl ester esterase
MSLHVERRGAGAPLVLLHGWGFHSSLWGGFAEELSRHAAVHLVDLPGHGRSNDMPLGTLDETADGVAALVPEGALLCGWSLGGLVALRIAKRHPSRVRALALLSTTPCFVQRPDWTHGVDGATFDAFRQDLVDDAEGTLRRFVRLNTLGSSDARATNRETDARLRERPFASEQALDAGLAILHAADVRGDAGAIGVPALIVHGGHDRIALPEAGRWLSRSLARASLLEVPEAAHLPFITHHDRVGRAILALDA